MDILPDNILIQLAIDSDNPGVAVVSGLVHQLYQEAPGFILNYLAEHGMIHELSQLQVELVNDVGTIHVNEALDSAIVGRQLAVVQYLVGLGIEPAKYALDLARDASRHYIATYLASLGLVSVIGTKSMAAKSMAAKYGSLVALRTFIKHGMSPTPDVLYQAVTYGHLNIVKYLVEHGMRIIKTIVDWAAIVGHLEIVKYFASLGRYPSPDELDTVASRGHLDMVHYFVDELNMVPTQMTLVSAVRSGNLDLVVYLVEHPTHSVHPDQSAINTADELSHQNIVRYLSNYGLLIIDTNQHRNQMENQMENQMRDQMRDLMRDQMENLSLGPFLLHDSHYN